ncbi:hypothetical protein ZHAS_00021051 [Anopheles sinensis]|uniref:Uncharacterized protein n=1 Tax=Anopheles sinensis TaxID=74873 RepID=A0A084WRE1_ANOSI|nr:hypothetical protein ZHAS_00021051 [Anopheles sinensis]
MTILGEASASAVLTAGSHQQQQQQQQLLRAASPADNGTHAELLTGRPKSYHLAYGIPPANSAHVPVCFIMWYRLKAIRK